MGWVGSQADGLQLQTLHMASGKASMTVAGQLLGPRQDAKFELNNFPASRIQPILQGLKGSAPIDLQTKLGYGLLVYTPLAPIFKCVVCARAWGIRLVLRTH